MYHILDNGLKVYLDRDNSLRTIALFVVFDQIGFIYDPIDKKGLSHLTEHMFFRSNENISGEEILRTLSLNGIKFNAFTSNMYMGLSFEFLPNLMDKCLGVLEPILGARKFKDDEFEKEKTIVITETEMYLNDPGSRLNKEIDHALFGDSDYGLYDTKDSVARITKEDVERWKQCHTNTENMFLILSGNFTDEHLDLLNKTLGSLDLGNKGFKKDPKKGQGSSKFVQMDTKDQIYYGLGLRLGKKLTSVKPYTMALDYTFFSQVPLIFREKYGVGYYPLFESNVLIDDSVIYLMVYGFDRSALDKFYKAKEEFFEKALDPDVVIKEFENQKNQMEFDKMKTLENPWSRCKILAKSIIKYGIEALDEYFNKMYSLSKDDAEEVIELMDLDKAKEVYIYKENIFDV